MKRFLFLLLVSLHFTGLALTDSEIKIDIDIIKSDTEQASSYVSGDHFIQFNNYYLYDILSSLTDIPIQNFQLNGNAKNPIISLKAQSASMPSKMELFEAIINALNKKLNITISYGKIIRNVGVVFSSDQTKADKCSGFNTASKIISINRTFKGYCIFSSDLINQIKKWYNIQLIDDLNKEFKYNFEVQKSNTFEEFIEELNFYYGIQIKTENRKVQSLIINY